MPFDATAGGPMAAVVHNDCFSEKGVFPVGGLKKSKASIFARLKSFSKFLYVRSN